MKIHTQPFFKKGNHLKLYYWLRWGFNKISDGEKELKVVDLGCGDGKLLPYFIDLKQHNIMGMDIDPRVVRAVNKDKLIHNQGAFTSDILTASRLQNLDCDIALMIDSLEHLDKKSSVEVIMNLFKKVRKGVLVFTTEGYQENKAAKNEYNIHQCGWTIEAFEEVGFDDVIVLEGYHKLIGGGSALIAVKKI